MEREVWVTSFVLGRTNKERLAVMSNSLLDSHSNFCTTKSFYIVKRYEIFSHVIKDMADGDRKNYMIEKFGRVVHSKLTDLKPEEINFLNQYNQISFERMTHKFNTQLYCMKNKIGVFRDPIYPKSYPWIIPKFTFECERADDYTKPNIFKVTQEFHRSLPICDKKYDDEMQFWQYKHYEKFHVNDPTVTHGPEDLAPGNLLFDESINKICYIDNEGFISFHFSKRDQYRYRIMSIINPHIGEYLSGKDCNTPYETMKDDWNKFDEVKVFFRRLFFYEKLIFNFQNIRSLDEETLIKMKKYQYCDVRSSFHKRIIVWQNWFHHEGEKVMQMTDDYVKPDKDLIALDRRKYPELFD